MRTQCDRYAIKERKGKERKEKKYIKKLPFYVFENKQKNVKKMHVNKNGKNVS